MRECYDVLYKKVAHIPRKIDMQGAHPAHASACVKSVLSTRDLIASKYILIYGQNTLIELYSFMLLIHDFLHLNHELLIYGREKEKKPNGLHRP